MNVETFNYSPESLAPFFYLNKRDRKNIYIFPTEKETLEFYNNFSNFIFRQDQVRFRGKYQENHDPGVVLSNSAPSGITRG